MWTRMAASTPKTTRKYSHSSGVRLTMAFLGLLSQDGRPVCLEDGGAGLLSLMAAQVRIATENGILFWRSEALQRFST
jgi:hypothetical protein